MKLELSLALLIGIFYLIFRPLIKKLLFQHNIQWVQNLFSKHKMELSKQEMELFLPLSGLWYKTFFYKIFFSFVPRRLNRKLTDWLTDRPLALFTYSDLFWPIWTYVNISGPNQISSQPMQDPACFNDVSPKNIVGLSKS